MQTFLWHDYETWGVDPRRDRPAQFAAIRTDSDLNPVGDPLMIYAKPPRDCLVQPDAVMVTGITPQHAELHGVSERDFIARIHKEMMQHETCSVGYNSLRFDDEVTRNTLYRNFYDPYEREYKNGNSRWDLIDVVRLCYALRPEGVEWPKDAMGNPSFRLENLTEANGIEQQGAHDALVDVRATIDVAKKIKTLHPKLFDYALSLRNKHEVTKRLRVGSFTPVFHVSSMFGGANHCCSVVLPIAFSQVNRNEVICIDLRKDPSDLLALDGEMLRIRQFGTSEQLADLAKSEGVEAIERLPIKNIHINKCPMITPVSMLQPDDCERLNLGVSDIKKHREMIMQDHTLVQKLLALFQANDSHESIADPDCMIYSGGFFSDYDKSLMGELRRSEPKALIDGSFAFTDVRLPEMLNRYLARNYHELLEGEALVKWQAFCRKRILEEGAGSTIALEAFNLRLAELEGEYAGSGEKRSLIAALADWRDQLIESVGGE
ncbi:MAG: exodeoxyribonuclease I [Cellvibrionales bacterium]|nr:exodeoxyribonuclease I [Cellvibrionales bacterium]